MSSEPPAPPGGELESINPYAASAVPDAARPPTAEVAQPQRNYRVRMTWADRRRFLQATGPLRVYAAIGLAMGGWLFLGTTQAAYELWRLRGTALGEPSPLTGIVYAVGVLFTIGRGCLTLYVCWLFWSLAATLAAVAGGSSPSMERWSRLQLRLAWLLAATMVLGLTSILWELLLVEFVMNQFRS